MNRENMPFPPRDKNSRLSGRIKEWVLKYYGLSEGLHKDDWSYQDRINVVKKMLNQITVTSGFLGILFISAYILNYKLTAKFVLPFFLASLMPYYFYGVMVFLLHKERKNMGQMKN